MPKYTFKCEVCGKSIQKYTSISCKAIKCIDVCSAVMVRQMPKLSAVKSTEKIDKFMGVTHMEDHDNILKERKSDYYWGHTVPELVDSGTYTLQTMLEQGWVYYNEKGELTTRTKPIQKS